MRRRAAIVFIFSVLMGLSGTGLMAQQNESNVSVFVDSKAKLIEEVAGEYVLHFYMQYDDRYTNAKEIRSLAEEIDGVEKFGIRNSPHPKTGRYLCYVKTASQNPKAIFMQLMKKFKCTKLTVEGTEMPVQQFEKEISNSK